MEVYFATNNDNGGIGILNFFPKKRRKSGKYFKYLGNDNRRAEGAGSVLSYTRESEVTPSWNVTLTLSGMANRGSTVYFLS